MLSPWESWLLRRGLGLVRGSAAAFNGCILDTIQLYRAGKLNIEETLREIDHDARGVRFTLETLESPEEVVALAQEFCAGGQHDETPGAPAFGAWSFDIHDPRWVLVSKDPEAKVSPEEALGDGPIQLEVSAHGYQARVNGGVWWLARAVTNPGHREIEDSRCYSNVLDWAVGHAWKMAHL
jgi:hypothetical protein